ncbi:MAG TPA: group I intron-associated PD-(D/E)XK endonuclease [Pyrinomonadaceae bacterium]
MQTGEKGNISEAKILAAFVDAGYLVSLPFGDGHKYDLVIYDGRSLQRVQCKTGRVRNGCLVFNACSFSGNGGTRRDYQDVADLFAALNPETDDVYVIPVEEVGHTTARLRLKPTLSKQSKRIRWAREYLLSSCTINKTK